MKIKMLTSMTGPTVQRNRGDEIDIADKEAIRLIEAGFAEPVRAAPREKATNKAPREKATAEQSAGGGEDASGAENANGSTDDEAGE